MPNVSRILEEAMITFAEKNEEYGDSYSQYGKILEGFFPNGIILNGEKELHMFANFVMCTCKLNRFAQNINKGGHLDSAHDLVVYAAMLEEKTSE